MAHPNITEASIRRNATAKSFERGQQYYRAGAVVNLVRRDNIIQALVEGSEYEPYRVSLVVDAGGIRQASCSCPYDYEGWCKHLIAVALACCHNPDLIRAAPNLQELLSPLNLEQTRDLFGKLAEEDPTLLDRIEQWVPVLSTTTATAPKSGHQRQTAIDPAPFRAQARALIRETARDLEYGSEMDLISEKLPDLVEPARQCLLHDDGENAIAILQAIAETLAEQWDDVVEYGLEGESAISCLDPLLAEAILLAMPAPQARIDLQVQIETWEDLFSGSFPLSTEALRQGWDDPELVDILQGRGGLLYPEDRPDGADELAQIRLNLLERQNRLPEYLHFARAAEQWASYLTLLIRLDRTTEALSFQDRLQFLDDAFAVAKVLREKNDLQEALQVAQKGLSLPKRLSGWGAMQRFDPDNNADVTNYRDRYELAHWASELAEGMGDGDTALELRIVAFKANPSLEEYQRVAMLAAGRWPTIQPELLHYLRGLASWVAMEAQVDIFLTENLVDDAIAAVSTYGRSELLMRVMDAAVPVNPHWVADKAQSKAQEIIDRGKAEKYDLSLIHI